MYTVKWIWGNLKGQHGKFIIGMILQLVAASMVIVNPSITGQIVDRVIVGLPDSAGKVVKDLGALVPLLLAMVGIHVFRMGLYYLLSILFEKSGQGMIVSMRTKLYDNLQKLDLSYYSKNRQGDIMTRLTGDLDMMRHGLTYVFRQLANSAILYVAAIIYLLTVNWLFTLILMVTTPLILIVRSRFAKRARPVYQFAREKLTELNGFAQENIESNRVVKAFAREPYEIERFDRYNTEYRKANLQSAMVWLRVHPLLEGLSQSLTILIVFVGGIFVINGTMSFGHLSIFLSLGWTLSDPIRMLGMLLADFERFLTSANKVMELFFAKTKIENPPDAVKRDEKLKGDIEFSHVDFGYGEEQVLKDITFHIKPGQTLAVMGNTGSGKTTIVNLLSRFFDVTSGSIRIDGVDVRQYDLQYLRKNIGMATQDVFLFSETVDSNIAYGDDELPEEEVVRLARAADADSFISRMPEGYQTIIGERGVGLSGGQRQRIALARALAVHPSILVLDDTTSAVDVETEQYIWGELDKLGLDCTRIVIANRVGSVRYADAIMILQDGKIVEYGTHRELMEKKGYYYETFTLQNEGIMTGLSGEGAE